jgi:hypothetical protein
MLGNIFGCTSGRLAVKVHRDDRFMQYQHRYMQVEVVAANFLTHCFCQFSACMHQGYRLSIMSIYIFFEGCICSKNYCLNMYTWSVYLCNISVKNWLYLRYKKIVAAYSGIKHWFFWHISCISKYNVYFPKISNVPLECVYVCTYLFVDLFES